MRILPAGDRAVLVTCAGAAERRQLDATLRASPPPGMLEHVPGESTVLVIATSPRDLPRVVAQLSELRLDDPAGAVPSGPAEDPLIIEVTYDGADLEAVARHLGVRPDEVVARHTGQVWRVEFTGFAPGFGYLVGEQGGLEVPRRNSPRTRVDPGSVGLAGPYSGVYPRASPGGWQLIGRTALELWDQTREPPALLTPGRAVRFAALGA